LLVAHKRIKVRAPSLGQPLTRVEYLQKAESTRFVPLKSGAVGAIKWRYDICVDARNEGCGRCSV
jgi:hypothetical protein